MVRIGHLERFVKDTWASLRFYVDVLGFEPVVSQPGGLEWVKAGEMEILLRPGTPVSGDAYRMGSAIVLYADDLSGYLERLGANGVELSTGDGDECTTFQDPDGYWFQVVSGPG
ncbi:MAG: VOC family protein [Fimbriimonadaceae bacterium]|nr:VOC family protein [Fimbriimonadaceae bacterium]